MMFSVFLFFVATYGRLADADWSGFDSGCENYASYDDDAEKCCWVLVIFDDRNAPEFLANQTLMAEFDQGGGRAMDSILAHEGGQLAGGASPAGAPNGGIDTETSMSMWTHGDKYRSAWWNTVHGPDQVAWWAKYAAPLGVTVGAHSKLVNCAEVLAKMPWLSATGFRVYSTFFEEAIDVMRKATNLYKPSMSSDEKVAHRRIGGVKPPGHF